MDVDATSPRPTRLNVVLAWISMLLASTLPGIAWTKLTAGDGDVVWLPPSIGFQIGALVLLLLIAVAWPTIKLLRLPLVMLLALVVGWRVLTPLMTQSAAWSEWQASQPTNFSMATSRLQWLPPIILMTLVAIGARLSRGEMFLVTGDWKAPVVPELLFPIPRWTWFPNMFVMLVLFGLFPILVWEFLFGMPGWTSVLKPDFDNWERVLRYLPGILAGSALNATFEEYFFRAALLACFIPAVGARHAVGLTAVLFGLEHWPTAGLGVIHTTYYGWVCGKSMVETRGWSWAVVVHIFGDIPIYTLVALSRA